MYDMNLTFKQHR